MAATEGSYEERRAPRGMARRTVWFPARQDYTSETKPFYLTSEFLVLVLFEMGLGISAFTSPSLDTRLFWILTTVAVVGYMVSRGLAKSGTRSRAHDPREDMTSAGLNGASLSRSSSHKRAKSCADSRVPRLGTCDVMDPDRATNRGRRARHRSGRSNARIIG
jgi:hypothetical protein